jgi:hypothetical protein
LESALNPLIKQIGRFLELIYLEGKVNKTIVEVELEQEENKAIDVFDDDEFKEFTVGYDQDYYQDLIKSFESKIYKQYLKKPQAEFKAFLKSIQNLMFQHIPAKDK